MFSEYCVNVQCGCYNRFTFEGTEKQSEKKINSPLTFIHLRLRSAWKNTNFSWKLKGQKIQNFTPISNQVSEFDSLWEQPYLYTVRNNNNPLFFRVKWKFWRIKLFWKFDGWKIQIFTLILNMKSVFQYLIRFFRYVQFTWVQPIYAIYHFIFRNVN